MKVWNNPNDTPRFIELDKKPCDESMLEIEDGQSDYGFYPLDGTRKNVEGMKLFCIDNP